MYQVLGPKIVIGAVSWLVASILLLLGHFNVSVSARAVVAVIDGLLFWVIFAKWAWRFIWNRTGPLGRFLAEKFYPDLNGTYDVVLDSNWPVVKRMLDASRKEADRFDPFNLDQDAPPLLRVELEATIDQTWFDIRMRMYPKRPDAVIKSSRTLVTIPSGSTPSKDKELIYLFEQENDKLEGTDEDRFCGAARLVINPNDPRQLSGDYWNNRMWRRGVNVAGKITLIRKSDTIMRRK